MKNYVHPGKAIVIRETATAAKSGDLFEIGDLVGVAIADAEVGEDLVIETEGVFYLPKVTANTLTVGDKLSLAGGKLNKDTTKGKIVAIAVEAAPNGQSHVKAKLLGTVLPAKTAAAPAS